MDTQDVLQLILLKITPDYVFLFALLKLMTLVLILMEITQHGNVLLFVPLGLKILLLTTLQ